MKDNYIIVEGRKYKLVPEEEKKVNSGFVKDQIVRDAGCGQYDVYRPTIYVEVQAARLPSWQHIAKLCAPLNAVRAQIEIVIDGSLTYFCIYYKDKNGDVLCLRGEFIRIPYKGKVDPNEPTEIDIEWIMKDE